MRISDSSHGPIANFVAISELKLVYPKLSVRLKVVTLQFVEIFNEKSREGTITVAENNKEISEFAVIKKLFSVNDNH